MSEPLNLRYELRAYETANSCRLASILQEATSGDRPAIMRDDLIERWTARYPQHAEHTGKRSVRSRIGRALSLLKVAGIARSAESYVVVLDRKRLSLAAANLAIVEDSEGAAVRPVLWPERPAVPEHLRAVQEPLEMRRLEAARSEGGH